MRRTIAFILMLFMLVTLLTGCRDKNIQIESEGNKFSDSVVTEQKKLELSLNNNLDSYTSSVFSGFKESAEELGYGASYAAMDNKRNATDGVAKEAYSRILVSAGDSANGEDTLSIQPADPVIIGDLLLQSAAEACGYEGKIVILAREDNDLYADEDEYIDSIYNSYASNQKKFRKIEIEQTFSNDYSIGGFNEAAKEILKAYPDCKCIIALTPMAMLQAAKVVFENESKIKVTGLGMPSEMELYIIKGIVQTAYLWNPIDYGYLTAWTMGSIRDGKLEGKTGESFRGGRLGNFVIETGLHGERRIILGPPMKFDINNISIWSKEF